MIFFVNQQVTLDLENKQNFKGLKEGLKIFLKFQLGVSKFQFKVSFLNFEVSDQVSKSGGTHEPL